MDQLNIEKIIQNVKQEFPKESIDISTSLGLVNSAINDVMEAIEAKSKEAYEKRDFSQRRELDALAESIHDFEKKIDYLITLLELDDDAEFKNNVSEETDEETDIKTIPNYSEYIVDHEVEHNLYESFTHIRPHSFILNKHDRVLVSKWNELLVEVCHLLVSRDEDQFRSFEFDAKMNGKKRQYISSDSEKLRKPFEIRENLYIEANQSANAIRYLLINMLKAYQINLSDLKIYFRADYNGINK